MDAYIGIDVVCKKDKYCPISICVKKDGVWSAKTLNRKYDIDHSMPFARWPNNDLWNLVPSNSQVNKEIELSTMLILLLTWIVCF